MFPTRNDIPLETRTKIVALLNAKLVDAIDLQRQAKQAHWNVKGPNFIALHELFDSIAGSQDGHIDDIAERITALGGVADGSSATVASKTSLPAYPLTISSGPAHVDALAKALAAFGKGIREAIDESDELGDADTADLFTGISRAIDKNLWFVEAHLHSDK